MSYIQACSTYYHQGSDLCEDFSPYFKTLDDEIGNMRVEHNQLEKLMQNRHAYVNKFVENGAIIAEDNKQQQPPPAAHQDAHAIVMEGYLFKRTTNAFKTWNRRWFYMKNNKLYYKKRSGEEMPTIMEDDLAICHVRRLKDSDRRFCFEVLSPNKSHTLQADSEQQMMAWINSLKGGIDTAIQGKSQYRNDMMNSASSSNSKNSNDSSIKKM